MISVSAEPSGSRAIRRQCRERGTVVLTGLAQHGIEVGRRHARPVRKPCGSWCAIARGRAVAASTLAVACRSSRRWTSGNRFRPGSCLSASRVNCVVSWVWLSRGSICSTSSWLITTASTGTPSASLAAAKAISANAAAGMMGWPNTLWSASQGHTSVPTSACQTWSRPDGISMCAPSSGWVAASSDIADRSATQNRPWCHGVGGMSASRPLVVRRRGRPDCGELGVEEQGVVCGLGSSPT